MEKGNFIRITPFIHVPDIEAAVAFFESLLQNHGDRGAPPGNQRFSYYIDVEDIEALYQELRPVLDSMLPGDVHGPADKPYGQREVCVLAPDGNLLVFGQSTTR
jgi:predicted enzyme related to lactoylglutathione lyase